MKDWTGQEYDETTLADPEGARAHYDANLLRHLNPSVSLNISGAVGGTRPAARCRTGFVLSKDSTCEKCGAPDGQACRSDSPGTAGSAAGATPPAEPVDPAMAELMRRLGVTRR